MSLTFFKIEGDEDLKEVHDYTIDAFSDSPDFNWTVKGLKSEIKSGWELFGVRNEEDAIVAAVFLKAEKSKLLTKNTGLKIDHQGSGYSHQIKEFFEKFAKEKNLRKIFHYCRIDNFRMYSLNESHGYIRTGDVYSDGTVVEWEKNIK